MRQAVHQKDAKALAVLAASHELLRQPPTSLFVLATAMRTVGNVEGQIEALRQAQRLYPGDFWINFYLAYTLSDLGPSYRDEAVSFLRAALAVRPQHQHSVERYESRATKVQQQEKAARRRQQA